MNFITLGPLESNHVFVTRRYLKFQGLQQRAALRLGRDFEDCASAVLNGRADFMIQCAVHPATPSTVAKWFSGLYVVDTFISPSQDLAIVQRTDAEHPQRLAVMAPTLGYIDKSKWRGIDFASTVAEVGHGLMDGRYEAGLAYASVAHAHPEQLRITEFVGTVDDAWIVYGRERVTEGHLVAWPGSPAAQRYCVGAAK